jgi:hypothetical protein
MTMNHYTAKFKRYSDAALAAALADCYETLRVGAGFHGNAYVAKLWSEIDAIRDIQLSRRKGA